MHIVAAHVRFLVALHADAVTHAMREEFSIARGLDHRARGLVHLGARDAGFGGRAARGVGLLRDLVDLRVLGLGIPHREGARQVGDVAVEGRAPVYYQQVAALELSFCRGGVRVGAVRPAGDDRRKRQFRLGAVSQQLDDQFRGQLFFGHADFDQRDRRFERGLRDLHRPLHFLDLGRVLPQPERGQR